MGLTLYNTMSRKKEEFMPINPPNVGLYACGPTVYNFAHIGNLRTYVFNDVLRRTLLKNGFKLKHVMNITDVGHLTSDADEGEDKMLVAVKREKKTVWDIAKFYTDAFFSDTEHLNIQTPETLCKATDHIKEMIEMDQKIEKNGFAYFTGGNLYFDTGKLDDYGKLARLKLDELKEGARTDKDHNKKNHTDFVLWFTKSKFGEQEMKWDSPWGTGYPGWHIECSAMSSKYLGEQFDIHTGGIDHIPVHHTNEIAQSEAATGKKPWVKYWIHGEFLVMDKGKMAKSSGTFITLQTVIDKGFDPIAYRFFCLGTHYRKQLMFSWEGLEGASSAYKALKNKIAEVDGSGKDNEKLKASFQDKFLKEINDDLNMPRALAVLNEVINDNNLSKQNKVDLISDFDNILGLDLLKQEEVEIPKEIQDLIDKREEARKNKDFALSDTLRDEIKAKGFVVEDTKEGPKIKKQ
ncbi:MAG: cysteine--tRNA ligase [Nanoarchaeota archaeon]|nr:cysteine--tRNA ligase [Nanoarchaeota archaeon]MBU1321216.1 cysteine--tRNA ligase [Nanoarchaeota archaeon]MBU1597021.1 cysteine--tRNA ligase [Nanoarchaeota archaeon]MBU2441833.1 cysteine--tRNA ligase [Nanoarchaeota archaeon]